MKNPLVFVFPLLIILLTSCNGNKIHDEVKELPEYGWHKDSLKVFSFQVEDTNYSYDLFLKMRISADYPFSNIWVRSHEEGPSGQKSTDRYQFILATSEGKWTGSGIGGVYTYSFPLYEKRVYSDTGRYQTSIEQYMRIDTLPYVRTIGLQVKKGAQRYSLPESY